MQTQIRIGYDQILNLVYIFPIMIKKYEFGV